MTKIENNLKWFSIILSDEGVGGWSHKRIKVLIDFEVDYSDSYYNGKRVILSVTKCTRKYDANSPYVSRMSEPFADGNFNVTLESLQRKNMKRVDVRLAKVMTIRDQIVDLYNAWDYQGVANLVQSL